jgi:hypothetical protein
MKSAVCLIAIFIGALHPSHEPLELPISRGFFLPAQPINTLQTLNKIYFLNKLLDMPHCADVK